MRSIFFRIYMGMLTAILLIVLIIFLLTYYLSKYRITEHMYQNYSGTFHLIGEGVARHTGEKRQQWLAAIESLSDLKFENTRLSETNLSNRQVGKLLHDKFLYQVDRSLSTSQIYILLPEQQGYLNVQLKDYGSSLIRISAFLMLNELGRHKQETRLQALENLRGLFKYPIQLKNIQDLSISSTNLRTIKKGDIAVEVNVSGTSTAFIKAYAPIGNSSYALVLGSIPFFDWFPLSLIISIVLLVLILMAATSFYLVKPLEKRLAKVDKKIEQIGQDKEISTSTPVGFDAIGKLTNTVNAMASRIHKLIDAQNDMVRAISHELRAPITRIRFRLAAIENQATTNDEILGIERDLDELETLIDEVLTFSKLKSEKPELHLEQFNLQDFLNDLIEKQISCKVEVIVDLPKGENEIIIADKRYLFRAINNLLTNAVKYTKSFVKLSYQRNNGCHILYIEDNGSGIPIDDRSEVFTPFKRLDASRDRQTGGYGLGLAIVQQVAIWHNGEVFIDDSEFGGAMMIFSWPELKPNQQNNEHIHHE